MNTGRPILLDRQKPEMPEEVVRFQKLLMKVAGAQRDVTITDTVGKTVEHKNVDLTDTKDGTYIVYTEADNTLYRYPLSVIANIVEKLKSKES